MSTDVVAQLAHEGVAVSMPILLLRRRRVGAPPRGAAVEHRGLWAAQAEMSALSTQSRRLGAGRRSSTVAAAWQRLLLARCLGRWASQWANRALDLGQARASEQNPNFGRKSDASSFRCEESSKNPSSAARNGSPELAVAQATSCFGQSSLVKTGTGAYAELDSCVSRTA